MEMKIFTIQMTVGWIFIGIIAFCIYIFLGLYVTENLDTFIQQILGWVIYTLLWITFLNVFLISYFWSVVRTKTGPYGIRGPEGEQGKQGERGECSVNMLNALCMQQLNEYIDDLYKAKTNTSILNIDTQKFPCTYLNEKVQKIATSRQFEVINGTLSNDSKPSVNLINYLKSIWHTWFELLYNGTSPQGAWFTDEFGDENYTWVGTNPFKEIKKYDVYYWGVTRDFRPLKAEICRSTAKNNNISSKLPREQIPKQQYEKVARLKVITSNDYYPLRVTGSQGSDTSTPYGNFWSANAQTIGDETYYPIGDIVNPGLGAVKKGKTIIGDASYNKSGDNGPDMKTILVSGDVKSPTGYTGFKNSHSSWDHPTNMKLSNAICPKGYMSLGHIVSSNEKPYNPDFKCVPEECVEINQPSSAGQPVWSKHYDYWQKWLPKWKSRWEYNVNALTDPRTNPEPHYNNSYNLFRLPERSEPYYKLKKSCLQKTPNKDIPPLSPASPPSTKELEPKHDDFGIGWYGHPYKLDPKYSIFSYLDLIPEGMIVHLGTGERFYIVHVEGDDINLFNIMTYNKRTNKYDNALQAVDYEVNTNWPPPATVVHDNYLNDNIINQADAVVDKGVTYNQTKRIIETKFDKFEQRQRWIIMLNQQNKKLFTLKNVVKKTYLYVGQEPRDGNIEFATIDLDNNNYLRDPAFQNLAPAELEYKTTFNFISTFGTQLNIIDE